VLRKAGCGFPAFWILDWGFWIDTKTGVGEGGTLSTEKTRKDEKIKHRKRKERVYSP
jgi:hypothetical protein